MKYEKILFLTRNRGIKRTNNINKVLFHSRTNESLEHFIIKAIISFLIFSKRNDGVLTEAEFENGRTIDVLQVKPSGNLIGYEIEGNRHNKKRDVDNVDIFEINIKDIPKEFIISLRRLYNWFDSNIVV